MLPPRAHFLGSLVCREFAGAKTKVAKLEAGVRCSADGQQEVEEKRTMTGRMCRLSISVRFEPSHTQQENEVNLIRHKQTTYKFNKLILNLIIFKYFDANLSTFNEIIVFYFYKFFSATLGILY